MSTIDVNLKGVSSEVNKVVTVGTAETEVFVIEREEKTSAILLTNTGSEALSSAKLQVRVSDEQDWIDLFTVSTDFTNPSSINQDGFLIATDDTISPTSLAPASSWVGILDTFRFYPLVRLVATVAANTTTIKVNVKS